MRRDNQWRIPASEPRIVLDHELGDGAYATHSPVVIDDYRIAVMTRLGGPGLVILDRRVERNANREVRVSLAGEDHDPGPITIEDGLVLASWCPRTGRDIHTCRVDALGNRWDDDVFVRTHLPGAGFSPDSASVESIDALPGKRTIVSWFEEDEPYGVGHVVRRDNVSVWTEEGSVDALVGDVVIGRLVVRLDVIAPQRPIIARRLTTGEPLWSRVPHEHEYEQIFAAFDAVLLVNDSRRTNAEMPSSGFRFFTPPAVVTLVDAASGHERWTRTIDGYVTSLLETSFDSGASREVALTVSRHDGRGAFVRIDAHGNMRRDRTELVGTPTKNLYAPPRAESWPIIVAFDGQRIVTWQSPLLNAYDANDLSRPLWSLRCDIEPSSFGFASSPTLLAVRSPTRVLALMA